MTGRTNDDGIHNPIGIIVRGLLIPPPQVLYLSCFVRLGIQSVRNPSTNYYIQSPEIWFLVFSIQSQVSSPIPYFNLEKNCFH